MLTSILFIVLTDLDMHKCPSTLINEWLPEPISDNLLFRVAVREVESWLIGDRVGLSQFLGIKVSTVTYTPDDLSKPKSYLINLARKSRKGYIKRDVVPPLQSTLRQGKDYNRHLIDFVRNKWDPSAASQNSPSLERCLHRIASFEPIWNLRDKRN